MYRIMFVFFLALGIMSSCGCCTDEVSSNYDEIEEAIKDVLYDFFKKGYEDKNTNKYMSAFGPEFEHVLLDDTSQKMVKSLTKEEEIIATDQIFAKYEEIIMELSPLVFDFSKPEEPTATTNYKIQFILADYTSDPCVSKGYYAKGESIFTFKEYGKNEWRIIRWKDKSGSPDDVNDGN